MFLTYNSPNRVQATYTIGFIGLHVQSLGKALSIVVDYQKFGTVFEKLKTFYTEVNHPLIVEYRKRNNRNLIKNITYGLLIYSVGI
ncbi:hypothetical protein DMENIID0001_022800 [Sergentomyia squamirostris]